MLQRRGSVLFFVKKGCEFGNFKHKSIILRIVGAASLIQMRVWLRKKNLFIDLYSMVSTIVK